MPPHGLQPLDIAPLAYFTVKFLQQGHGTLTGMSERKTGDTSIYLHKNTAQKIHKFRHKQKCINTNVQIAEG
jgi:hypothetical protein